MFGLAAQFCSPCRIKKHDDEPWSSLAQDARRDVRQSAHLRTIDGERFAMVISMLAEKVEANDVGGVREALVAVKSLTADPLEGVGQGSANYRMRY